MPTIRIGFSSDFVLNNNRVGLGTTVAAGGNLDVDGAIKGNFSVTGVATLASYGGFVVQKQQVNKPSTIGFATVGLNTAGAAIGVGATQVANQYYETETGFTDLGGVHHGDDQYFNTLSEDLVIDDGQILNITNTEMVGVTTIGEYDPHTHASHVCAGSLEQVSVTGHFSVPCGKITERKENPVEGTVRFNDDLVTLEFFNGVEWRQFTYNQGQSGRMLIGGNGDQTAHTGLIQTVSIPTLGEFTNFGDLSQARDGVSGGGDSTRAVFCGGATNPGSANTIVDTIDYNTIASGGDGQDFGNLTGQATRYPAVCSSSTRVTAAVDDGSIFYVQTSTTGNALDGGNIFDTGIQRLMAGAQSPTRGYHFGGFDAPLTSSQMSSFSIASMGKAVKFGDLLYGASTYQDEAMSNTTRAVLASESRDNCKHIAYITMTTEGVASYFGDLTVAARANQASSTLVRGLCAHRRSPGDSIAEYITFSTGGNAVAFGELAPQNSGGCTSDSHGGLGGF